LLSNTVTNFSGHYYEMKDAYCEPKPVQRPHPPIVIGGTGERRTLRTVARWAQHWNFPGGTIETWTAKRDVLHRHCAEIGRDPTEITTSVHVRVPADGGVSAAAEDASHWAEAGMDLAIFHLAPPHTPKVLEPLADALQGLA
jgi:alkanesulfonate monooxygenase SsuD/methylene tetrahydromethanopterin reductase-like flavin-dependent oxidoreductase (luciferase family)